MKTSMFFAVAMLAIFLTAGAFSQTKTPVVDKREKIQQKRIEQGAKSGELTKGEVRRLERHQGRIKAAEINAKADSKVTGRERAKLQHMQNKESKRIYRSKHNNRVRP